MSRHRILPSPFLSSSSHTTQFHYTNSYTYSHPNLNFLQYTIQIFIPHVMWSAQAVRELKIDRTQCHLSACAEPETRNSAVGWHWKTHTHILGEGAANQISKVPLSNNTIRCRISEMSCNINEQVVGKIKTDKTFAL